MCDDYKPYPWNWKPIPQGGTYPATNITESASTLDLSRVVIVIEPFNADTVSLTLDSDATGITINDDTAGSWDYTIGAISAATTLSLVAGFYTVTQTVTMAGGVSVVVSKGTWKIIAK